MTEEDILHLLESPPPMHPHAFVRVEAPHHADPMAPTVPAYQWYGRDAIERFGIQLRVRVNNSDGLAVGCPSSSSSSTTLQQKGCGV
jgi:hypothetical protein